MESLEDKNHKQQFRQSEYRPPGVKCSSDPLFNVQSSQLNELDSVAATGYQTNLGIFP